MKTTFLKDNYDGNLEEIGIESLKIEADVFRGYMEYGTERDEDEDEDEDDGKKDFFDSNCPFNEYGLCFGWVDGEGETQGFFRYQLSYGGPSDEIRFYGDMSGRVYKIEYVYMDWFCGVGFDITKEDWAIWLKDYFDDVGVLVYEPDEEDNLPIGHISNG